jgi:hypothetical protein
VRSIALSKRLRPALSACLLALATAIFYGLALSRQPVTRDEARIVSAAQQPITGVVINTGDRWLQPIPVLATKAAHVVRPGFHAGRWASVVVSAIDVALIFLVAWRLFGGYIPAVAAAVILVLTPAHMTYGRTGIEAIFVVPFVLLWLYAFVRFVEKDRPADIALASVALGAGVYTTTAAPLTMAFLWLAMMIALWVVARWKLSTLGIAAGSFAVMLVPLAAWFVLNPQTYLDTYGSWAIHLAHIRNPIALFDAFMNRNTLGTRATTYWGLIDPSYLFFSSDRGRAPLHWTVAPWIIAGIVRCVHKVRTAPALVTLLGALIAPLAGAGFGQPQYIANALTLLPFVTLLAAYAVDWATELVSPPIRHGLDTDADPDPFYKDDIGV